jgi:hypothetical protein
MNITTYLIGCDDEGRVVGSDSTQEQIQAVRSLECELVTPDGVPIDWDDVDNPDEEHTLFQSILVDRKRRMDEGMFRASRPRYAVVTADGSRAIRLEFFEGQNVLRRTYDLRAASLYGEPMPSWADGTTIEGGENTSMPENASRR